MTTLAEARISDMDAPPSNVDIENHISSDSEARLRTLLDQQGLIQAEIRSLISSSSPDFQRELAMLNHKHKMLKASQEEFGK